MKRTRTIVGLIMVLALLGASIPFLVYRDRPAVRRLEKLALYWGTKVRVAFVRSRNTLFRKISGRSGEEGPAGIQDSVELGVSPFQFLDAEDFRYSVKPLFDSSYHRAVLDAIEGAKRSVKAAISHIDRGGRNGPADQLVQALVKARARGVNVEVVLDYPQSRFGEVSKSGPYKKNEEAIEFLKKKGCEAYFDTPERALHDKLVLVDHELAIIGTHDWTDDSLSVNNEVSVLVRCSPTSAIFQEHFEEIEREKKPESREMRLKEILRKQKRLLER